MRKQPNFSLPVYCEWWKEGVVTVMEELNSLFPSFRNNKARLVHFTLLTLHGWLYCKLHPPLAPFILYWGQHGTPAGPRNPWCLPPSCSMCPPVCISIDYCFSLSIFLSSLSIILALHLYMEGKETNRATKHEPFDLSLCKGVVVVERVTAI